MSFDLFDNIPAENLTTETDLFGTLPKAEFLNQFIEIISKDKKNKTKIIGLYGEWGIGKSTVVNYLKNNLTKKHVPILFEAWKYEKDENLVISLIDFFTESIRESDADLYKELMKGALVVLKGFSKAISFKAALIPNVIEAEISGDKIIDTIEKEIDGKKSQTLLIKEFEAKLKAVTHKLKESQKKPNGKIILFVDDLDRCEPENLLNLITAIKLFISLSDDIIFFLPIDKSAIKNALQHRYQDAIKSEQYLEKVFDITFNLESEIHYEQILKKYFTESIELPGHSMIFTMFLSGFLKTLNFTNPRAIKKLINKYQLIAWIKYESDFDTKVKGYIPNIFHPNHLEFSLLETLLTIYMIILYDFYNETYENIADIDGKFVVFSELTHRASLNENNKAQYGQVFSKIKNEYTHFINGLLSKSIKINYSQMDPNHVTINTYANYSVIRKLYVLLGSKRINSFYSLDPSDIHFCNYFKSSPDKISANFFTFFENNIAILTNDAYPSENYSLTNLFRMVKIVS